jgi:ribosomal protein S18 acetylase RimI-like enzyme
VIGVVEIEPVREVTLDLTAAFARLIPQLSSSSPPPDADELAAIVGHPGTTLFVAKLDDQIVGTLTLIVFPIPTGMRAWIEDVVVDEAVGGKGIGRALTQAAIDKAQEMGARTVDLTSRPSREVANHLYQRMGFELRNTNVYRYTGTGD